MTLTSTVKVGNHRRASVRRELLSQGLSFIEDEGLLNTAFIITAERFIIDALKSSIKGEWK